MKIMNCNLCGKKKLRKILKFGKKPIVHHLKYKIHDKEIKYEFDIANCLNCGHLQIYKNIDPAVLYKDYFTPSSWKNNWHSKLLLEKTISIFNLKKTDQILEIGSNDGYFIEEFKRKKFSKVYGIEPSKDVFQISKKKGHKVINHFFNHKIIKKKFKLNKKFDLVYSRQVLEHIPKLKHFFHEINKSLRNGGYLMLELPDHDMYFENFDYSFWEEHVNYFNRDTLEFLLAKNNFRVIHHETTLFSGKAIIVFAEKNTKKNVLINRRKNKLKVKKYQNNFIIFRKEFQKFLKKFNKKIYIYGCGNRSCNIINLLNLSKYISGYIDDNKEKQNKFVPYSNLKIFSPKDVDLSKSVILLGVNTENENLIIKKIKNNNNIYSILPPSKLLPKFWKDLIDKN